MNNDSITETEYFEHHRFLVGKGQSLVRIDKYLSEKIAHITRCQIQKGLKMNCILVNNQPVKPGYRVKPMDTITVILPGKPLDKTITPEPIPMEIIYEDQYLLIVNKPAGMLIHPTFNQYSGTLWNGILYHYHNLPASEKHLETPGLIHRIDQHTSGLILIAKEKVTRDLLLKQFEGHTITRKYMALVWGKVQKDSGTITEKLLKNSDTNRIEVSPDGKSSITHYRVMERFKHLTLVECSLETGRTHQIRAHLKYLGHPLFNDTFYGGHLIPQQADQKLYNELLTLLPGQALHAFMLGFIHPENNKYIEFQAKMPSVIKTVIEKIKNE